MVFFLCFSCREICRRTFRGCLRIPGCKTICYKCILPPCCSSDSDDEKEEKDDEGYDSYGITASQNHLPESQPVTAVVTNSVREDDFENHDYINEPAVEEVASSQVDNKLAEVMYVSMNMTDDEEENVASKPSVKYTVLRDTSNNNQHDYVNESVLFAKSDTERETDFSNCQTNGALPSPIATDCTNEYSPTQRQKKSQVTNSSNVKEYETRSLESRVADGVSNQQTLILLETDL